MKAKVLNLRTLFATEVSYRIPQFQRAYAWKMKKQWKPLWEDVSKFAERLLDLKGETIFDLEAGEEIDEGEDSKIPPHFMGAIVLQPRGQETGEVVKRLVVDGQQRLTTLQLLIQATKEAFWSIAESDMADRLAPLTLNKRDHWGGDSDNQTKIRQSNLNDQKAFQKAIRGLDDGQWPAHLINDARKYFKEQVTKWLDAQPANRLARANALEQTLTRHLQIAAIDLDTREKPHFIFEVLNTRGESLTQSDLIKNTVMYEADVVDDAEASKALWGMFDSDEWWRGETKEGRLTRIHLDRFLNYWMVMSTNGDVTADRISSEFSHYMDKNRSSHNIHDIAADIRKAGVVYRDIDNLRIPGIETFLQRMKTMELGVVVPPLLWLYTRDIPEENRQRGIRALESYLIRRMLCGYQSQGLNRLFIELLANLKSECPNTADRTIIEFLEKQTVENRSWPRDDELFIKVASEPLKGTVRRRVMVLEAIESHLKSDKTESVVNSKLTVEHIMPESWENNWPLDETFPNRDEAVEARKQAVQEIGNLTLVTGKLNSSLSNDPWNKKRETLKKHTVLRLNLDLVNDYQPMWDETTIRDRGRHLADKIIEIWPFASKL